MQRYCQAVQVLPESLRRTALRLESEQMAQAEEYVRKIAQRSFVEGSHCEVTQLSMRVAMDEKEENKAMLAQMNNIYETVGLPMLTMRTNVGGSDASDMTYRGITCVDSLGVVGDFTHSVREKAEIASLAQCAKRLAAVAVCLK